MNPFLQRIQASADLDRSLKVLSCTRFCSPSTSHSKDLPSKDLLAALGKLRSGASLQPGDLQFDRISPDHIECVIRRSSIKSSSRLESIANTLSPTLIKAGWWRLEVTASPYINEARISMTRRKPSD